MNKNRIINICTIILTLTLVSCQQTTKLDENMKDENCTEEECCSDDSKTSVSETSEITCPECGFKKVETLPTDVCQIKYACTNCSTELTPKSGDCCVFCTHGTHKCPSMQDE